MKQGTLFLKKILIYEFFCLLILFVDIVFPLKFIKEVGFSMLSPIIFFSQNLGNDINDFLYQILNVRRIYGENKELLEENSELKANKVFIKELEEENKLLREDLNIGPRGEFSKIEASVIISENTNSLGQIVINKGNKDNLSKGMPIVIGNNLIGVIRETFHSHSIVTLINSPQSKIPVKILDGDSQSLSFVEGDFGLSMKMTRIDQDIELKEGLIIITSGKGNNLPLNLVVGEISEIYEMKETALYQEAKILSNLDFNNLYKVMVILETEF